MLSTSIKTKPILIKFLGHKLIVNKNMLKPKMNKDIGWLAQSKTTKTLLWQLSVIYSLSIQGLAYLTAHYIMFFGNLMHMHKLLPVVNGDLFFITPIFHFIFNIPVLLLYQLLLVSLLGIMGSINGCGVVSNLIQIFNISIGVRESPGDVIIKDIKGMPPLRPKLLKKLKSLQWNYPGKLTSTQLPFFKYMHQSQRLKVLNLIQ